MAARAGSIRIDRFCSVHEFGAITLGLPITRKAKQTIEGDCEVSVEVPAPVAPAEQLQVKGHDHFSEMWLRIEDNLHAAVLSGRHPYLVGKVDQILLQIKGGRADEVMYPPSMFGFGCGRFPETVDKLEKEVAACMKCKMRTASSASYHYCNQHMFAAAVLGAKVEP
jgi:hypothetical protein